MPATSLSSSSRCLRSALKRPTRIDGGGFCAAIAISLLMGFEANEAAGLGFSGGRIRFWENIKEHTRFDLGVTDRKGGRG